MPENPDWLRSVKLSNLLYSNSVISCISIHSSCELSDEGRYLIIYISRGAEPRNKLLYSDLHQLEGGQISGPLPITKLVDNFDADWDVSVHICFEIKMLPLWLIGFALRH